MFNLEQEALLCKCLSTMAELVYGFSRQETIKIASDFAYHLGLCDKTQRLSLQWLYNFLSRWPELKVKKKQEAWKLLVLEALQDLLLIHISLNFER